jgi:uncharacterized protein YjbJ (UPF0337 family)
VGVRQRTYAHDKAAYAGSVTGKNHGVPAVSGRRHREQVMSTNKDQVDGRVKEAKGKLKEVTGNLVGNESMEAKGKLQKLTGQAQAKFGDVKQDLKDAKKGS